MNTINLLQPQIMVRDATEADIPMLTAIQPGEANHRDILCEAQDAHVRVLALERNQEVIGFGWLVFRRPIHWSDADNREHLPQIVNLNICEAERGLGYGSMLIRALEREAVKAGYQRLYIAVEPIHNSRAYALYQRLGYRQIQSEPYLNVWEFIDSAGNIHHGEDWIVDMVKTLKDKRSSFRQPDQFV